VPVPQTPAGLGQDTNGDAPSIWIMRSPEHVCFDFGFDAHSPWQRRQ